MSINGTTTEETGSWGLLGRVLSIPSFVWRGVEPTVVNNTVEVPVKAVEVEVEYVLVPTIPTASELRDMVLQLPTDLHNVFDINDDGNIDFEEVKETLERFSKEGSSAYMEFLKTLPYGDNLVVQGAYSILGLAAMYCAAKGIVCGIGSGVSTTVGTAAHLVTAPVKAPISWAFSERNQIKALTGPEATNPFKGTAREVAFSKLDAKSPFVKWMNAASEEVVAIIGELNDEGFNDLAGREHKGIFERPESGFCLSQASTSGLRCYFAAKNWLESRRALTAKS